jgi:hypothetical protein
VVRRPLAGVHRRAVDGIDLTDLIDAGRAIVEEQPRTFSELGARLATRWPDRDPGALALAVRALLPLVATSTISCSAVRDLGISALENER